MPSISYALNDSSNSELFAVAAFYASFRRQLV